MRKIKRWHQRGLTDRPESHSNRSRDWRGATPLLRKRGNRQLALFYMTLKAEEVQREGSTTSKEV